jgi:Fe-S-cluster containining protein
MECGNCTACCTVLPIKAINKPINTPCPNCLRGGCSIYDNKPQTCTEFECAYLQAKNVPVSLRPDRCGVIFIKKTDSRFDGVLIKDRSITETAKAQIEAFKQQGYEVNFGYL